MAEIKIDVVTTGTDQGVTNLQKFDAAVAGVGQTSEAAQGKLGGLWAQFAAGVIAAGAIQKAVHLVTDVISDSIREAAAYEKAVTGLNAAFEISGRKNPGMVSGLRDYADQLQKLGLADDVAILKAQSLLMQLTRLDESGIKAATRGAIGLASVFGMDLQSAAEMVAKGMEGNFFALNRLIPAIREATTEDGKRAAMMRTFEDLYKRAIADTDTYAGSVKKMGLEWGEAKKHFGEAILNTGILQTAIKGASAAIEFFTGDLSEAQKIQRKNIDAVNDFRVSLQVLQPPLDEMRKAIEGGPKSWEAYKNKIKEADDTLAKNKTTILGWIKTASDWLGLSEKQTKETDKSDKSLKGVSTTIGTNLLPVMQNLGAAWYWSGAAIETMDLKLQTAWIDIDKFGNVITMTAIPACGAFMKALDIFAVRSVGTSYWVSKSWAESAQDMAKAWQQTMSDITKYTTQVTGQLGTIFQQANTNRMAEIDNEYNARKKAILATVADEAQKNYQLNNLDKEFEVKRRDASRQYAAQQKAVALANAIVNTAEGVTKALAAAPPPFNAILAAITAALGAVQIALIARQPLPLAKGAIFNRPTILTADTGSQYEVGEGGEPEILSSPRQLQQAIAGGGGRGNQRIIHIHNYFTIGATQIREEIAKVVMDLDSLGKLKLKKAFA